MNIVENTSSRLKIKRMETNSLPSRKEADTVQRLDTSASGSDIDDQDVSNTMDDY
jgi:hypothetical protein